ncbi:MAG: hypothetical protein C4329_11505 [Chitinophagaceae bacterium]
MAQTGSDYDKAFKNQKKARPGRSPAQPWQLAHRQWRRANCQIIWLSHCQATNAYTTSNQGTKP